MFLMNAEIISITILLLIISYVLGSIPFGLILGKTICKIDISKEGSGNIGSTNAIRILGKQVGFVVFFLDVFKGMVMILLIKYILEPLNLYISPIDYLYFGIAAILGHCFSIFYNFKGGKAVATSLGVVLVLTPLPAILCLLIFGLTLYTIGYVSISSTFAALTVGISSWILHFVGVPASENGLLFFISQPSLLVCSLYSIMVVLIIFKHIKNYKRIINKTEHNILHKDR